MFRFLRRLFTHPTKEGRYPSVSSFVFGSFEQYPFSSSRMMGVSGDNFAQWNDSNGIQNFRIK